MRRKIQLVRLHLALTFLCGCAAGTQSSTAERGTEPDCSFRTAATCWTMSGRFPPRRQAAKGDKPDSVAAQPPVILASEADTATTSR